MKKVFVLISVLCLSATQPLSAAQKQKDKPTKFSTLVKAANLAMKNSSGQDGAENNLLAALPRTDLSEKDKAYIYYLSAQLEESKNGVENRKAYLKQNYDTAAFFSTLLRMYDHLYHCDSIDAIPNGQGRVKLKYQVKTKSLRQKHRRNILNGGKFFLSKGNYDVAYNYMDLYYTHFGSGTQDTTMCKVANWAALCGFMTQKPDRTLKYIDLAIASADNKQKPVLQEYKVRSYMQLNDQASVRRELLTGVRDYPLHDFFFVHLEDIYYGERDFASGLSLADSLIAIDSSKTLYWYTKSKLTLAGNDYVQCIEFSDSTIHRDSSYVDAYYNKGISYLNLALIRQESACVDLRDTKSAADRKQIQELYQQAKPCMEKVRQLQPDATDRWGRPLYRIYMKLNMGKEFEEIDKLLNAKSK